MHPYHANPPDHPANQTITVTLEGGPYDGQQVELTVPQGVPRTNEIVAGPKGSAGYMMRRDHKHGEPVVMLCWKVYDD